jgi:hypothetical protein
MSDHHLRWSVALALTLAACSGDEPAQEGEAPAPAASVPQAGPPLALEPLGDAELMGLDRGHVVLNLPWSNNVLAKSPAPNAARATLQSVSVERGPSFDRFTLGFGTDAPYPGYRVVWNDLRTAGCGGEPATELPAERTLLVAIEPAAAREGPAAGETVVDGELTIVERATRVCDRADRLVWALAATDSSLMRTIELRDPPRLVVDVQHPTAGTAAR